VFYACMAGFLVLVGIVAFLAVPVWQTRKVMAGYAGYRPTAEETSAALERLGGPRSAIGRLRTYLAYPDWIAPRKLSAMELLAACGQEAVPALVLALDPRRVGSPQERLHRLDALARAGPALVPDVLLRAALREPDEAVLTVELLLLGLSRRVEVAELLGGFLDDERAEVRAAAADGLGILHRPAYPIPLSTPYLRMSSVGDLPAVNAKPTVRVHELVALSHYGGQIPANNRAWQEPLNEDEIPLSGELRDKLDALMLRGATAPEREAAARALLRWPPNGYRLRVAEWGVWLAEGGELKLVQSVLDEIPPFVHRTGNPAKDFGDRINQIMTITKPILHLTADRPMAVDLGVMIRQGRPWFAYPRPDDFCLDVATRHGPWKPEDVEAFAKVRTLDQLDSPALAPLKDLGEGYPRLEPRHRQYGAGSGSMGAMGNELLGLGLRWQSLIVSPERLPWMKPPDVPADGKFAWWSRLRRVGSSWLSSRGEAERFLYYDGPTLARAPVTVRLQGGELGFSPQEMLPNPPGVTYSRDRNEEEPWPGPPRSEGKTAVARRGMYLEVAGREVRGQVVEVPAAGGSVRLADAELRGPAVREALARLLAGSGLSAEEAEGLLDCWAGQFFETEGRRFLTILSAADYDAICPLSIRPAPTALVRVGLVLTELRR
jgi:hypothetical protein